MELGAAQKGESVEDARMTSGTKRAILVWKLFKKEVEAWDFVGVNV